MKAKKNKEALQIQINPDKFNYFSRSQMFLEHFKGVEVQLSEGNDNGPYVNINCFLEKDVSLKRFWKHAKKLLKEEGFSPATIITCTGKDGWNDYLLLHHYDPSEKLDNFPR